MTGGDDAGTDREPDERALQSGRAWQHPSEVGLATRGRADRRRSTLVASGVVLGGAGLLLAGVIMGTMNETATATTSTMPVERAGLSVTMVVSSGGDGPSRATGLVVDDDGHLLVDGGVVVGAEEIRAECADGEMLQATVVGRDPATDLAVLRLEQPTGVPASVATSTPTPGVELRVVSAFDAPGSATTLAASGSPSRVGQLINLAGRDAPQHFAATVTRDGTPAAAPGEMVFDRSGRLAGVVAASAGPEVGDTVRLLSAADAMGVAEQLIAAPR